MFKKNALFSFFLFVKEIPFAMYLCHENDILKFKNRHKSNDKKTEKKLNLLSYSKSFQEIVFNN